MHTSINQMLYPDRQAFFEKLALSLPPQPAIKIGPVPMPCAKHNRGLRIMRKAVPTQRLSTAQRSMEAHGATKHAGAPMITETSKLDSPRSREPLFHRISQDYLTREAPQHFACEAVVFWVIMMAAAPPLLNAANAVLELIRSSGGA